MSRYTNTARVEPAAAILAAQNTGGTQVATEVSGYSVGIRYAGGLRFRKVAAAVYFEQSASGTGNFRFGLTANFQSRLATSGTGSTWADFGTAYSNVDSSVPGTSTGAQQYVYQVPDEQIPANALQVRLQYTPKAITEAGVATTASGGIADIAPVLLLTDPNKYPADADKAAI